MTLNFNAQSQAKLKFTEPKKDLGKVSVGRSCIRFKKLTDLNLPAVKKLLQKAAKMPGLIMEK